MNLTPAALIPPFSVVAIFIARMLELRVRRDLAAGSIRENFTLRLIVTSGSVIFLGSIMEYFLRGQRVNWTLFAAGWVCAIASFWVRRQAIAALGRFWSLHVEIREGHEFVRSGPFRFMRHPAYFSMMLELLALTLICNAFWTLLLIPGIYLPVLAMRVRIEEAAMMEKFGDAYRDYRRTTPAFFPWRWQR